MGALFGQIRTKIYRITPGGHRKRIYRMAPYLARFYIERWGTPLNSDYLWFRRMLERYLGVSSLEEYNNGREFQNDFVVSNMKHWQYEEVFL